jgi:hypothetical protein
MTKEKPAEILRKYRTSLMAKANVVGCGVGKKEINGVPTEQEAVVVLVARKVPYQQLDKKDMVPTELEGVKTDVICVGEIRLLSERTLKIRPAKPGCSIGHYRVSAGTFGAVAYDAKTKEPLILSNNHVLANSTNGRDQRSQIGDPIYQPGTYDQGTTDDIIGRLTRYVPINRKEESSQCSIAKKAESIGNKLLNLLGVNYTMHFQRNTATVNLIDAALAKPLRPEDISPEILGIGLIKGVTAAKVGMNIKKSGRTSGVNAGRVRAVSVTVNVGLGDGSIAQFDDQIITTPMAQPGDSGSVGVTVENHIIGLLFAGSNDATIYNRIENVMEIMQIGFMP